VEYSLSYRERLAVTLRHRVILVCFLAIFVVAILSSGEWWAGFLAAGLLLGVLAIVTLLMARLVRAHANLFRVEVDDSGVSVQQRTSSVHLEWPFVKRVRRSGSFFILSQMFLAFPIPRRSFREPGSEETFRAFCRAHTRTNF
jgi:Na+/melibiose symporter-like transporter